MLPLNKQRIRNTKNLINTVFNRVNVVIVYTKDYFNHYDDSH